MNRGLKSYTKQIKRSVGGIDVYANVNKADSNLIMNIPIISTTKLAPINISVIYNHLLKSETDEFIAIGGLKLNLYHKFDLGLSDSSSVIMCQNVDGSLDRYTLKESNIFINNETMTKITKISSTNLKLEDKYGNVKVFNGDLNYPKTITTNNGEVYSITTSSGSIVVTNTHSDKITITKNDTNITFIYTQNYGTTEKQVYKTILNKKDGKLSNIEYYHNNVLTNKVNFNIGSAVITLLDVNSNDGLEVAFSSDKVSTITEIYNNRTSEANSDNIRTTTITYLNDQHTAITDFQGYTSDIYFDEYNLPLYDLDKDKNVVGTRYDNAKKVLLETFEGGNALDTNNLMKNISVNNFTKTGLTLTKVNSSDSSLSTILNNTLYKVTGTGTLTYNLHVKALGTDSIAFGVWCKMLTACSTTSNVTVSISGNGYKEYVFENSSASPIYEFISLGKKLDNTLNTLTITFTFTGNASMEIGGLMVLKKDFGSFYEYDEYNNVLEETSGYVTKSCQYDENNLMSGSLSAASSREVIKYNSNNQPICKFKAYETKLASTYDENRMLTEKNITGKKGTIHKKKTYSIGDVHEEEHYNDFGEAVSRITYDDFGRANQIVEFLETTPNIVTSYTYELDLLKTLSVAKGTESSQVAYEYNTRNLVSKITLSNGTIYEFGYDDYSRITTLKINSNLFVTYTYDTYTGDLVRKKYANGDGFKFLYNSKGLVYKIYYLNSSNAQSLRYTINYDSLNRVSQILNSSGTALVTYSYDVDGRVIKVTEPNNIVDYTYDNLGKIINEKLTNYDIQTIQSFDTVDRSQGSNPQALEEYFVQNSSMLTCSFIESYSVKNKNKTIANSSGVSFSNLYDGVVPYTVLNSSKKLNYKYNYLSGDQYPCGCVGFWFKINSLNSYLNKKIYLFSTKVTSGNSYLEVYCLNKKLYMKCVDFNGNTHTLAQSKYDVIDNKWNFFAANWMNRQDNQNSDDICIYELTLNAETVHYEKKNPRLVVALDMEPTFDIGYTRKTVTDAASCNLNIAYLMMGNNSYIGSNSIRDYYRITKDYIIDNVYNDGETLAVDFGVGRAFIPDEQFLDSYDVILLHNNVVSTRGEKPLVFNPRKKVSFDKDRTFNFNHKIKDYAYVADGNELKYNYVFSGQGAIMMKVYLDTYADKQYLFECVDEYNKKLALFRNSDKKLCIECDGVITTSTLTLQNDTWSLVGFASSQSVISDSMEPTDKQIRLYLDGTEYCINTSNTFTFTDTVVSIGAKSNYYEAASKIGTYNTNDPLLGQIEMMLVSTNTYLSKSSMDNIKNQLFCHSKVSYYDDLSLPVKTEVHKDLTPIVSNIYTYEEKNGKYSTRIKEEEIKLGNNTLTTRSYTIDKRGFITEVTDSVFGTHLYEYDYRGFLIKDNDTTYTYDKNGNITKNGSTNLTYSTTIKDRLASFGSSTCSYNSNNPFMPTQMGSLQFTFEGNRLIGCNTSDKNITFTYDINGLRKTKTVNGDTTKYFYSGDKLLVEDTNNYTNRFLYDEKGQLYGFIQNEKVYFYVRDIMNNILGISSQSGELVVKYSYDAYGKLLSTTGTLASTVGVQNPFLYKGYIYDRETGLYYCKSRYYNPNIGRWISPDAPEYLNPTSINGLNLYCYCENNPIVRNDNNGKSWKSFWESIGEWFVNTFGAYIESSEKVSLHSNDNIFFGSETGIVNETVIGDDSKPISVFASKGSEWWKFWEYQVGFKINIGKLNYNVSYGIGEKNVSYGWDNTSIVIKTGIDKVSFGFTTGSGPLSLYHEDYIRTIPTLGLVLVTIFAPELLPASGGALALGL